MGASFGRYQRVGQSACESCNRRRESVLCSRCSSRLCRQCFTRACNIELGGLALGLPLSILFRKYSVCDSCWDAEDRESIFASQHGEMLISGTVVWRIAVTLFSESKQQVWLRLDVSTRTFTWKSLEMVRQEPKDSGAFSVDDIAGVQAGHDAVSAASMRKGGTSSSSASGQQGSTLHGAEVDHTLRCVNERGHGVFMFTTGSDGRVFAQWSEAIRQLLAIAKLPNCKFMPSRTAVAAKQRLEAAAGQTRSESNAARDERAAARATFRDSLGPVGMSHAASILANRASTSSTAAASSSTTGAAYGAASGETGTAPRFPGTTVRTAPPPMSGPEALLADIGSKLTSLGQAATANVSNLASQAPPPVQEFGRSITAGFRSMGAVASQALRPPVS